MEEEEGGPAVDDELAMSGSDEEDNQVEKVERKFNYAAEISIFADYSVLSKYFYAMKDGLLHKHTRFSTYYETFFTKIIHSIKGEWLFYQADYLSIMSEFLERIETQMAP